MKPSSFCCICTDSCAYELVGLLLSLSLYHTDETIYVLGDILSKQYIEKMTPQPRLNIVWNVQLDKYSGLNRQKMEQQGIWSDFQIK